MIKSNRADIETYGLRVLLVRRHLDGALDVEVGRANVASDLARQALPVRLARDALAVDGDDSLRADEVIEGRVEGGLVGCAEDCAKAVGGVLREGGGGGGASLFGHLGWMCVVVA